VLPVLRESGGYIFPSDHSIPSSVSLQDLKRIIELAKGVYRATQTQPLRQDGALRQQVRKAAISIGSNIAEGYERGTRKQFIEFCFIAKGSAGELRSQIIMAHDIGLLDEAAYKWLLDKAEECSRQLAAFIRHLHRTESTIPGLKRHYADEVAPNA